MTEPLRLADLEQTVATVPDEVIAWINNQLLLARAERMEMGPLCLLWDGLTNVIRQHTTYPIDFGRTAVHNDWLARLQKLYTDWKLEIRWKCAIDRRYNNLLVFHAAPAQPARDGRRVPEDDGPPA